MTVITMLDDCPTRLQIARMKNRPSALVDPRVIYCGDCLDQLRALPPARVDLMYTDFAS